MNSDIFRLVGIGLTGGLLAVSLRTYKPELAILVSLATGLVLFFSIAAELSGIWGSISAIMEKTGIEDKYFLTVVKVSGVAYLTQFAAEICRDSGENATAGKIELAGKISVLALSMPMMNAFLDVCIKALNAV